MNRKRTNTAIHDINKKDKMQKERVKAVKNEPKWYQKEREYMTTVEKIVLEFKSSF